MLIDARTISQDQTLHGDLCIVGAGAAGISLAREFIGMDLRVILLEGGGNDFDHRNQFMYRGEISGRPYLSPEFTRRRQFGGTTVTWSGRCRPLDELDFEGRPWVRHGEWPFSKAHLDPYFERAHTICEAGPYDYTADLPASGLDLQASPELNIKLFQFSPPTNFKETYGGDLVKSTNIQVYTHANLVRMALDKDARTLSSLHCMTLQKKSFKVTARAYVLATGGLEVPRLLLASRDCQAHGIGNANDLVGRFFMEHPHITSGVASSLPQSIGADFLKLNYEIRQRNLGTLASFGLSDEKLKQEKLLNASAFFVKRPAYKLSDSYFSQAMADFMEVNDILRHATAPAPRLFRALVKCLQGAPEILSASSQIVRHKLRPAYQWGIRMQLETVPNPESRVLLSEKRDALGMPRIDLRWKMTGQDLQSFHGFEEILYAALPKLGIQARRFAHAVDADGWPVTLQVGKHHMGTTRMDDNPRLGVVDRHSRVHDTTNLYIASSSVFPSSGMANPTLTIVALALRLADRLKTVLGA
ncbi:MAG: GMC family oxidoreductase [Chloroflexi bacterium]|nr:GMC family oxidoreductase [Chloroflexota bacterium]